MQVFWGAIRMCLHLDNVVRLFIRWCLFMGPLAHGSVPPAIENHRESCPVDYFFLVIKDYDFLSSLNLIYEKEAIIASKQNNTRE